MNENMNMENREEYPRQRHKQFNDWWRERSLGEKIILGFGLALLALGFGALMGLVTMLLWNWLMPDIFGLKTINYWQSWGLLILSWLLFNRFGSNGSGGSRRSDRKRKEELRRHIREDADTATGD